MRSVDVEYSAPIRESRRQLCVMPPQTRGGQTVLSLEWNAAPGPDFSEEICDDFGNRILLIQHRFLKKSFRFKLDLTLSHDESTFVAQQEGVPPGGIGAFLLPSALCNFSPEIEALASKFRSQRLQNASFETVQDVCSFLFERLEYAPQTTTVHTSATQTLESRRGVCQDFAHLMVAICRRLKVPARYISGYLLGNGAPHAWCEVLLEGRWHGFDPTHGRIACPEKYFYVACGRDFRDCAPHSGSYRGNACARLSGNARCRELSKTSKDST